MARAGTRRRRFSGRLLRRRCHPSRRRRQSHLEHAREVFGLQLRTEREQQ